MDGGGENETMFNLHAIALIAALLISASAVSYHIMITFNNKMIQVVTGIVQGVPIPREMRWRTLMQIQLTTLAFAAAVALLVAFLFFAIGNNVEDAEIQSLARLCAVPFIAVSAIWLLAAPLAIIRVASQLRRADSD
jgi:hypothetical protein